MGGARTLGFGLGMVMCILAWILVAPNVSRAAECTATWVGPEAGKWTEAENWSTEAVPGETDVVCIPASKRVEVDSGAQRAETLQGEGEIVLSGASLALVGLTEPSNIGTLRLKAGGELGGTGEIVVTKSLLGEGGRMKGDGYTKLGAAATGTVVGGEFEGAPGLRVAQKRVLSVHGSLVVGGEEGELRVVEAAVLGVQGTLEVHGATGAIVLRESATLVNGGTLTVAGKEAGINATDNAEIVNAGKLTIAGAEGEVRIDSSVLENTGELTVAGPAGRLLATESAFLDNQGALVVNSEAEDGGVQAGTSISPPHLENTGTIIKTQGTGAATIEVKLDNEALVQTESGTLRLTGGGTSGKSAESTWVAVTEILWEPETKIVFADENFALGEATLVGVAHLVSGSSVTADRVKGEAGAFWLYDGNLHIADDGTALGELGIAGGTASLAAGGEFSSENLEITSDYLEESEVETLEEPAELILGGGSTAHVESLTQEQGSVEMKDGAILDAASFLEAGTFKAGDQTTFAGEVFFSAVPFEAGSSTQFLIEEAFVSGGSFELGPGSTVNGKYFFQENGATTFGAGTTITESEFMYSELGTVEFGESSTATMPEMFYQQEADVFFGPGVSLDAGEMAYFQEGLTTLESGSSVEGEEMHIESAIVTVKGGAELRAGELNLYYGELTGAGPVVTDELGWWNTVMAGSGTTEVLEKGKIGHGTFCSKGTCEKTPAYATLRERELVLHENFTLTVSTMGLADGAKLVNLGSFDASSEKNKWGPQIQTAPGSSSPPKIVNRGRFEKLEGTGTTVVDVPFWNFGAVGEKSGTLDLKQPMNVRASERFGYRCYCGDPVETATGDFGESQTDIAVGGLGVGLELTRTYSALAAVSAASPGIFGYGWFSSFSDRLDFEEEGKRITLVRANGSTVPFLRDGEGGFDPPVWSESTLIGNAETGYAYKGADQIEYAFAPNGALQSVTDRNSNETTLAYDEAGRLKSIEDPAGRKITLSYNGNGLVEKAEDPMGHVVQYAYEGKELASVTMPGEEGPRWQFDYDGSHRMTTMTDGRGGEVENEYDAAGRVLSQTDPAGRTLNFFYESFHTRFTNEDTGAVTDLWFNSNNQPTSITRGYGTKYATTESYTYDEAGHQLTRTDGNGHTTTYTYNAAGDRTSVTDAEENKTEWAYNATHDVISNTTPKGLTTTIARDAAGNPETVSRPAPGGATQTTSFDYDALGQLESMTDPLERIWSFEYDAAGNLEAETDPEGHTRRWGYDENSRVTSIVSPRGNEEGAEPGEFTTTIQRDPRGRAEKAIDPLGHDTEFVYDGNGNLGSVTNAKGKTTEFVYNGADELVETKKPNGAVLITEYDGAGEIVAQIDGNEEKTTYVRNVLGQPIEVIDPLSRKTVQEFDAAGNLKTVVDPAARVTTYVYDSADRLEEILYSNEATPDVSFEHDADGNLTRMIDGSGESTYVYDQLGRLEEATNGHGDTVSYEYDLAGQQERIVYPNGKGVDQVFDDAGRLESVTDWLGETTTFAYDADSNLEEIQFPSTTGNVDEFSYDRTGRMTTVDFKKGAESLASISYERDPLGQVEAMVSQGLPGPEEETYGYDGNNRLAKAGAEAFEYDKADNPIKTPGSTNAFDDASQLKTGTGVSYSYNQLGERTGETTSAPSPGYNLSFGNQSSGPGRLSAPAGVAIDAEGNAWVADTAHNRIQQFNAKGQFLRQFGTFGTGDGQLYKPRGIAIGPEGNLFVADTGNNRVQVFKPNGEFLRQFGTFGTGNGQFKGLQDLAVDSAGNVFTLESGGSSLFANNRIQKFTAEGTYLSQFGSFGSANSQLKSAGGIAVGPSGDIFVADTGNNRVQVFKPNGEFIRKFGNEGTGNGQLKEPQGLAIDGEGNVWIADTGNDRMQRFSAEGAYLAQFGTSGLQPGEFAEPQAIAIDAQGDLWVADTGNDRVQEASASEFIRQFGNQSSGPGRLSAPAGVAIDAEGNAWVADTAHNRIQKFDSEGKFVSQFGTFGTGDGQFNKPRGLAIGPSGNLFVADTGNSRVQVFKPSGEYLRKFGSEGTAAGQFKSLQDLAVDSAGNVFTLESGGFIGNNRVQKLNSEGAPIAQFGANGSGNGQFSQARGVALDGVGNIWVADSGNNRLEVFKPNGEFLRKFGTLGSGNGQLNGPQDLVFDGEGNLWVVDTGNGRLQRFSAEGAYLAQFGTPGPNPGEFAEPQALTIDVQGDLWVADTGNDRVQETSATEFIRQFGGESSGPGHLSAPGGVAIDAEGNAWVADTAHNRIQQFNAKGQFLRQFGTFGTGNGQFSKPRGLAIGPEGNLFVADTGNNRVQVFKPNGEFLRQFGTFGTGNGQFKGLQDLAVDSAGNVFTLEGGGQLFANNRIQKFTAEGSYLAQFGAIGSENGQLKSARGISLDASGNVWVADTANNRVQAFKPGGEFIRKFGTAGTGNGQLKEPEGLATDSEGNIWVADTGNNRMQRFSAEGAYLAQFGTSGPNPGEFSAPQAIVTDAQGDLWVADTGNDRVQEFQWQLSTTYGYDQAGRLTSVQRSRPGKPPTVSRTFAYDGSGLLASHKSGSATRHMAWDVSASLPLLLDDDVNSYVYGPYGVPIIQISAGEEPTYFHHDQLGSTRMLTDGTGEAAASFTYTAYGELAGKTGTETTPLGYAGQYTEADTGLQYLRARFYDPATAQFLTRDPIEHLTGQPYAYALGNPLQYGDPTGLFAQAIPLLCGTPATAAACAGAASSAASACASNALCRDTVGELGDELSSVVNSIFGDDDADDVAEESAPYDPSEAKERCPNFDRDWQQDKKVTDRELKEAGLDAHELKELGNSDIYKDREGNLYEKPKGGRGPGEDLGINIKNR